MQIFHTTSAALAGNQNIGKFHILGRDDHRGGYPPHPRGADGPHNYYKRSKNPSSSCVLCLGNNPQKFSKIIFSYYLRDSGFGIRDSGFGIRDSGYPRRVRFGIRDSGFGIRDSGSPRRVNFSYYLRGLGRKTDSLCFSPCGTLRYLRRGQPRHPPGADGRLI